MYFRRIMTFGIFAIGLMILMMGLLGKFLVFIIWMAFLLSLGAFLVWIFTSIKRTVIFATTTATFALVVTIMNLPQVRPYSDTLAEMLVSNTHPTSYRALLVIRNGSKAN